MNYHTQTVKLIRTIFPFLMCSMLIGASGCSSTLPARMEIVAAKPTEEELSAQKAREDRLARFQAAPTGNDSGMTIVSKVNRDYKYKTSYMVISKAGTVIVMDPFRIPAYIEADLIISTHGDDDHNDSVFYKRSSARKSLHTLETFTFKDITVTGIPSSHQGDDFDPANPSNMIYLVEVDGLRIAVMGDICQTRLTDAQLTALGRVDIAFMIMFDAPQYSYTREQSFTILSQLKPKFVFPTHTSSHIAESIGESMGGVIRADYRFAVDAAKLGTGPCEVVLLAELPD